MAERSVNAFNREYQLPHLLVFADRNRVEKEETFEIASAARDRFMLEILIETPDQPETQAALIVDPSFHDVDSLISRVAQSVVAHTEMNAVAALIQQTTNVSAALQRYMLDLWRASRAPYEYGITLDGVDTDQLILAGASPRGMSMLLRAARVGAWLQGRNFVAPEDVRKVFFEAIAHRIFFNPVYELRRSQIVRELTGRILERVAAP